MIPGDRVIATLDVPVPAPRTLELFVDDPGLFLDYNVVEWGDAGAALGVSVFAKYYTGPGPVLWPTVAENHGTIVSIGPDGTSAMIHFDAPDNLYGIVPFSQLTPE